jgi:hypothetical protein
MRRLSLVLLPFLAAFALVFGLFYLYAAFRHAQNGRMMYAGLVGGFGIMGIGLAAAIWVVRKRVLSARTSGAPAAPGERPSA